MPEAAADPSQPMTGAEHAPDSATIRLRLNIPAFRLDVTRALLEAEGYGPDRIDDERLVEVIASARGSTIALPLAWLLRRGGVDASRDPREP